MCSMIAMCYRSCKTFHVIKCFIGIYCSCFLFLFLPLFFDVMPRTHMFVHTHLLLTAHSHAHSGSRWLSTWETGALSPWTIQYNVLLLGKGMLKQFPAQKHPFDTEKKQVNDLFFSFTLQDPQDRPTFTELVKLLDKLLVTETDYIQLEHFPDHNYYNMLSLSGEKL